MCSLNCSHVPVRANDCIAAALNPKSRYVVVRNVGSAFDVVDTRRGGILAATMVSAGTAQRIADRLNRNVRSAALLSA